MHDNRTGNATDFVKDNFQRRPAKSRSHQSHAAGQPSYTKKLVFMDKSAKIRRSAVAKKIHEINQKAMAL